MKVLLVNGSPHAKGSTWAALSEVEGALAKNGVECEWFHIGTKPVQGCVACGTCKKTGACVFTEDGANDLAAAIRDADGVVIGSPVYYAGPNGALCALLDRAFYSSGRQFIGKPGAVVAVCRRGGASAAIDRLLKYFSITQMPVVSSQYWPMVYGMNAEQVRQDEEGMQTMRVMGSHMARMLKGLAGEPLPEAEAKVATNFIR